MAVVVIFAEYLAHGAPQVRRGLLAHKVKLDHRARPVLLEFEALKVNEACRGNGVDKVRGENRVSKVRRGNRAYGAYGENKVNGVPKVSKECGVSRENKVYRVFEEKSALQAPKEYAVNRAYKARKENVAQPVPLRLSFLLPSVNTEPALVLMRREGR